MKIKNKIKKHFEGNYNLTDEQIQSIIENDCECSYCGVSVFKDVYINFDGSDILCDNCYDNEYRDRCPICEESYDIKDGHSEHFIVDEVSAKEFYKRMAIDKPYTPGIYTKFGTYEEKLVLPIRINEYERMERGDDDIEIESDSICPECVAKFIGRTSYLSLEGVPCLLLNKYRNELFQDWSDERIRRHRQNLIHRRITCRGIVEKANKQLIGESEN